MRRDNRHWLPLAAFVCSGGVGLLAGWTLDLALGRRVQPRWRWLAVGGWALVSSALTRARWIHTFYLSLAAVLHGAALPGGGPLALTAGWGCWTLVVSAALPAWREATRLSGTERLPPAPLPPVRAPAVRMPDGLEVGRDQRGRPCLLRDEEASGHVLVAGPPGAGKTSALLLIVASALRRGLPVAIVDGHGSAHLRRRVTELARAAGRELEVWSCSGPRRYDPLRGDAGEARGRLLAAGEWVDDAQRIAAGAYLEVALEVSGARTLPEAARACRPRSLAARIRHLHDPALAERARRGLDGLDAGARRALIALSDRLAALAAGAAGPWLGPGDGDLPAPGGAVLFSLDPAAGPASVAALAGMLLVDCERAAAAAPAHPLYLVLDEYTSFPAEQLLRLLDRGRAAGLSCVLAARDPGGAALIEAVAAHTGVRIVLRQEEERTAARLAAAAGTGAPGVLRRLPPFEALLVRRDPTPAVRRLRLRRAE